MAKAGYCSECGRNVYLTPEGACEQGHGPECISLTYDVVAPPTESQPASPSAPAESARPVYPSGPAVPVTPPRNRTGLVVMIVVILLLLCACVLGGPIVYQAINKTTAPGKASTPSSPARAKITASIGFMEALLNNDTLAIKPFLTDDAQAAIPAAQWPAIASVAETAPAQFSQPGWSGDTTAVVTFDNQETTGTITFSIDPAKPDSVVMDGVSLQGTEHDIIGLVKAGTGWRVGSLDNGAGDTTAFDADFVRTMVP